MIQDVCRLQARSRLVGIGLNIRLLCRGLLDFCLLFWFLVARRLTVIFWISTSVKGGNSDFQPVIQDVCRLVRGISSNNS